MISVIIPVYNVEKYIDKCLESVINQTFDKFEVILIDDGSTDASGIKCKEWKERDSRILFIQKCNQGLGMTRNLGVELSKYDYITFLDSDDWWEATYLEKMMRTVIKYDADIVCCDMHYWEYDANGKEMDSISELRMPVDIVVHPRDDKEVINTARTFMCGKVFKKKLFLENDILQPNHAYEDVPVTPLLMAKADKIVRIGAPLYYYYRKRSGSLANTPKLLVDMKKSIKELIWGFKKHNLYESYKMQLHKMVYSQVRFIFYKSEVLCDDEKEDIKSCLWKTLIEEFPSTNLLKDMYYVLGHGCIENVVKLLILERNQLIVAGASGDNRVSDGRVNVIIDLLDVNNEKQYKNKIQEFEEMKKIFNDVSRVNIMIMMRPKYLNCWQERVCEYTKKSIAAKVAQIEMCDYNSELNEGQLWNIADNIFYEIANGGKR